MMTSEEALLEIDDNEAYGRVGSELVTSRSDVLEEKHRDLRREIDS